MNLKAKIGLTALLRYIDLSQARDENFCLNKTAVYNSFPLIKGTIWPSN